ncbi:MAG: DUF2927 domain-containing protein [Silicimonas sp.]|nr:DUF2927 domain-containing protein [Silicimonas sp.]
MRAIRILALGAMAVFVSACDQLDIFQAGSAAPPVRPSVEAPDDGFPPESLELVSYYANVERGHRTRGLLRADGGGPDVPFDAERLAKTFRATAFAREFTDVGPALVRREAESILHRWEDPVRIEAIFGSAVSDRQRADDGAAIRRFADRLGKITRHPVSIVQRGGNFQVLVLTEAERRVAGPLLQRLIPGIRKREIDLIQNLDRSTYCVVVASDPVNNGVLTRAVAIIRAELPPLLRLSCIHEEISQGLGLANDSPTARPSIFNDDDEFGRLTAMDELMLRMLYDLRLKPGMDADTAAPIVRDLAETLTGNAT